MKKLFNKIKNAFTKSKPETHFNFTNETNFEMTGDTSTSHVVDLKLNTEETKSEETQMEITTKLSPEKEKFYADIENTLFEMKKLKRASEKVLEKMIENEKNDKSKLDKTHKHNKHAGK